MTPLYHAQLFQELFASPASALVLNVIELADILQLFNTGQVAQKDVFLGADANSRAYAIFVGYRSAVDQHQACIWL